MIFLSVVPKQTCNLMKLLISSFIILSYFPLQMVYSQDLELPHNLEYYIGSKSAYFGKIGEIRSLSEVSATVSFSVIKTIKGEPLSDFYIEFPVPGIETREYKDPLYSLREGDHYLIVDPIFYYKYSNYWIAYNWKDMIHVKSKQFVLDSSFFHYLTEIK